MNFALRYIRWFICTVSVVVAVWIYFSISSAIPSPDLRNVRIDDIYALIAFTLLYCTLLISPLYSAFPILPLRVLVVKSRRALGVSAFFFALLHTCTSFFFLLGGFAGLGFLSSKYILAITLSFTALIILSALAATSFNYFVSRMGSKWKMLHRLVYVAALLIVIHAVMLGSHFIDLSRAIPQIFLYALLVLLILEALRFDKYMSQKFPESSRFGFSFVLSAVVITVLFVNFVTPHGAGIASLGVHAEHIKIAQQAQTSPKKGPRYSVSFLVPDAAITPNTDVTLKFKIYNADTGEQVRSFDTIYDKIIHLVIVGNELIYFSHIHPELKNGEFSITTQLPKNDLYHLYLDFQPQGQIEQQFALTLPVGSSAPTVASQSPDQELTKVFGNYKVTLAHHDSFRASDMSAGQQPLIFGVYDAASGKPATNLLPYLGSFGHLVMVNQQTYEYIHVHPTLSAAQQLTAGPAVEFLPLGLNGPIKPGVYRVFAQLNPNGTLMVADFTITIE